LRTQDFELYIWTDGRTYGEVQNLMTTHNLVIKDVLNQHW